MSGDATLHGVGPPTPRHTPASSEVDAVDGTAASQLDAATATGERRPAGELVVLGPGAILEQRYRLEERIGRGGMGEVWRGTHLVLGRALAIKLLIPDARPDSTRAERMMREARLVGRIAHPNVVEILDTGETASGLPFLVMALVDGAPLSSHLRRGPLTPEQALVITEQLCAALQAAHAVGVLHRDLKPANVLVRGLDGPTPHCTLIDFGIAKATQWGPRESTLTNTGVVYGTPAYMSPEQARGEPLDVRADVYALGVLLFEMLTGKRPFRAPTPAELLYLQLFVPPPLPSVVCPERGIAPGLDAIVRRSLYKDREHRFADMAALRSALRAVREGVVVPLPEVDRPVVPLEIQRRHTVIAQALPVASAASPVDAGQARQGVPTPPGSTWAIALGVVVLALLAAGAWWLRTRTTTADDPSSTLPVDAALEGDDATRNAASTSDAHAAPPPAAAATTVPATAPIAAPAPATPPIAAPAPAPAPTPPADAITDDEPPRPHPRRESSRRRVSTPAEPRPAEPPPDLPTPPPPVSSPPRPDADGIIR